LSDKPTAWRKPAGMGGDPVEGHGIEKHVPLFLLPVVFAIYLITAAPTVYLGDSGEFTAAAFSLGIPHNSGYPLYSLVGKIFCLIPLGNVGFRMNLMSALFASITVFLTYDIILRFTRKILCSLTAACFLAFTPLFWSQTVSAEVYPLHCFFMALMIGLLWQWDQERDFRQLLLFVFVTGLSFANHMQTVMLAPPVLYFIISGDKRVLFTPRRFTAVSIFFILPLLLYLYLPLRTQAGAAIHWGDPDNLERFLAHVTATAHRGAYVFSAGPSEYLSRFIDGLRVISRQYGVLLFLSLWGWMGLSSLRWKIFFVGVLLCDMFYTVFLNIISLEITPFTLPSSIVLAILMGMGLNRLIQWAGRQKKIGTGVRRALSAAFCLTPLLALTTNFGLCDQSKNYTAYEHALNIFRTVDPGSTIFLDGDNNVFPVAYGRIVEAMGQGITLHDRHNVIFKWRLPTYPFTFAGTWEELESTVIKRIVASRPENEVYFAVMNPYAITLPREYRSAPWGILRRVVREGSKVEPHNGIWAYYSTESHYDNFYRDYMNREVTCRYFFRLGEGLYLGGKPGEGLRMLRLASAMGYDDTSIHSDLGVFYADHGLFEKARGELEKALKFHDNLSGVLNNWGYCYHKEGEYEKAVPFFKRAIHLEPDNHSYYNNLGFTLSRMGDREGAASVFRKSLSIKRDQPEIVEFMHKHDLPREPDERISQ